MYLGQGIFWADVSPARQELGGNCDCGRPVEPGDFLCFEHRDELNLFYLDEYPWPDEQENIDSVKSD